MSKQFGKKRVADCRCTYNFTCGPCLQAAGPTVASGDVVPFDPSQVDGLTQTIRTAILRHQLETSNGTDGN